MLLAYGALPSPSCSGSLLPLALPWHQLAYLSLCLDFDAFLEVISLCTNLQECRTALLLGRFPTTIFPPAGIRLPRLRKLCLNIDHSAMLLYSDFFRPLVLPNLEEFAFDLNATSDERLAELRQAIECLCLPDLLLEFGGAGMGNIVTVARSLPLTTMKAPEYVLFKFNMDIISRDLRFQKAHFTRNEYLPRGYECFHRDVEDAVVSCSTAEYASRNTIRDDSRPGRQARRHFSTFSRHQGGSKTVGSFGLANYL